LKKKRKVFSTVVAEEKTKVKRECKEDGCKYKRQFKRNHLFPVLESARFRLILLLAIDSPQKISTFSGMETIRKDSSTMVLMILIITMNNPH